MKKKVLVVDDDDSVRESLKKVLQDAGYEAVLAAGGLEAMGRCELDQVDLVLLDLNLPNQSGWDIFEPLTTHQPFLPVIIITGLPNQYATALAAGASALFEKPIEVSVLLKTMEELLAEPNEVRLQRLCGHLEDTRHLPPARALRRQKRPNYRVAATADSRQR